MDKDLAIKALRDKPAEKNSSGKAEHVLSVLKTASSPYPAITLTDEKNPPDKDKSWGFHLLVDCSKMNDKINSEKDVEKFFDELIDAMDMKKLTEFFYTKVDDPEDGRGMSAFQMITTSHISMHFDDAKNSGYLDIFSCKKFDPKIVLKMIEKHFKPKALASQMVFRDAGLLKGKK